jgi:glycogen operon protein
LTASIWPGKPYPQGATNDGSGTNFALFTENGQAVDLCLFDADGEETRLPLPQSTGFVHHGYVPEVTPGQRYGFRVHGDWRPSEGSLFNPAKLLLDPYGKVVEGDVTWSSAVFGHDWGDPAAIDTSDSAASMPRSVVVDDAFDWEGDQLPRTPMFESVIYETHVKGISASLRDIPEAIRGTYAGLASERVVSHLVDLGVTAVELMPVHQHVSEHDLIDKGLTNYWGYSTIGFFAPHAAYAAAAEPGDQVREFKSMVRRLHKAGIEVILDVVYNHTAESGPLGPTLSFRGIDNATYYRLDPEDASSYIDYTACGNSMDVGHPQVLTLIMDSLRYWVEEMHVDGFRFDLAPALARDRTDVNMHSSFFDLIHQDPVIGRVKLIAEPWDVGPDGYQVGQFPPRWSEWNGKYRDSVREFWQGKDAALADFGSRFAGSADLYRGGTRRPQSSINFVTAHDGFTLRDLVSYNEKHNDANGEDNRDGDSHNRSWNSGAEGETDDHVINVTRGKRVRAILTTLMLSQGVPMLLGGDEFGRTQRGNNNAYCQDNDISWYDWEHMDEDLLAFTTELIRIRREHPVFRRRTWLDGRSADGIEHGDAAWFNTDGTPMKGEDWDREYAKSVAVYLNGRSIPSSNSVGVQLVDDSFLVLFNAHSDRVHFTMPDDLIGLRWEIVLYSATGMGVDLPIDAPETGELEGWSVALLRQRTGETT